jgi:methionyl-tRNA formyltransferase
MPKFGDTTKKPIIKQPEKIKDEDFTAWIREVGPSCDAFVVVSYGKILPQWLLDLPKHGVVNVHGSLLPRWRGASPIQAAIASGDTVSGVTIMQLDARMDLRYHRNGRRAIADTDTGGSLHDRLADIGGSMLPDVLSGYIDDPITPDAADHDKATSCTVLKARRRQIDWSKDANVALLVRAYNHGPAHGRNGNGKRLKIHAARVGTDVLDKQPSDRFIQNGLPCIAAGGSTTLELITLQPGKASYGCGDILRGNRVELAFFGEPSCHWMSKPCLSHRVLLYSSRH